MIRHIKVQQFMDDHVASKLLVNFQQLSIEGKFSWFHQKSFNRNVR